MIPVHCHTNLDLVNSAECWPEELPAVPNVGDLIESAYKWKWYRTPHHNEYIRQQVLTNEIPADYCQGPFNAHLELEVVRVVWISTTNEFMAAPSYQGPVQWMPKIELHLPKGRFENLIAFYEWYGEITSKGRSYFI